MIHDRHREQRPEAFAAVTEALPREPCALDNAEQLPFAVAAGGDVPATGARAAHAIEAVEQLTDPFAALDYGVDAEVEARGVRTTFPTAATGPCRVDGCGGAATQFVIGPDGGELAVCSRCGEELRAILP